MMNNEKSLFRRTTVLIILLLNCLVLPVWAKQVNFESWQDFRSSLKLIQSGLSNWNVALSRTLSPTRHFIVESVDNRFRFEIQPFYQGVFSEVDVYCKEKSRRKPVLSFSTRQESIARYTQLLSSYKFLSDKMDLYLFPMQIEDRTNYIFLKSDGFVLIYPQISTNSNVLITPKILIELNLHSRKPNLLSSSNLSIELLHSLDFKKIDTLLGENIQ